MPRATRRSPRKPAISTSSATRARPGARRTPATMWSCSTPRPARSRRSPTSRTSTRSVSAATASRVSADGKYHLPARARRGRHQILPARPRRQHAQGQQGLSIARPPAPRQQLHRPGRPRADHGGRFRLELPGFRVLGARPGAGQRRRRRHEPWRLLGEPLRGVPEVRHQDVRHLPGSAMSALREEIDGFAGHDQPRDLEGRAGDPDARPDLAGADRSTARPAG